MAIGVRKSDQVVDSTHKSETIAQDAKTALDPTDHAAAFDPAILKSMTVTPDELVQSSATPPGIPNNPVMPKISDKFSDPHSVDQISLSVDSNGPKIRMLRSHRHCEVWIRFDEKPPVEIAQQLKDNGWQYYGQDKTWVMSLELGREVSTMLDAERLFKAIANQFREAKGLDPVGVLGPGAD